MVVIFADVLAYLGTYNAFPPNLVELTLILLALGIAVNVFNRYAVPEADPVIVPVVLVLNGLSYVMMERLEPYESTSPHLAGYQAIWSLVGFCAYVITMLVFRRTRDLERYRYLLLVTALVMLVLPLAPGLRDATADSSGQQAAYLWVRVGPISFQPVEFAKILLVVFFASYFVEKREMLSMATSRLGDRLVPDLRSFGPIVLAWLASIGVILLERDVGFSLIFFVLFLVMLWVATGRWLYIVLGIIAFALGTFLAAHILSQVNVRIEIWLDPWKYLSSYGYQPAIAEVLMGKGGIAGQALGLGSAWQIPVAQSDFIFAAIGNELGLIGTSAIVVAFMLFAGSGIRIASRARSDFAKLAAVGFTMVVTFQAFIIMAGVTRILPLTGVTLPFVSYGGSSLVANYIVVALLLRISNEGSEPVLTSLPNVIERGGVVTAAGT